jgi:hypothetical protein
LIVVAIEAVSPGAERPRRSIATMHIVSADDSSVDVANYRVTTMEAASAEIGRRAGIAEFTVSLPSRSERVWVLLQRACEEILEADFVEF